MTALFTQLSLIQYAIDNGAVAVEDLRICRDLGGWCTVIKRNDACMRWLDSKIEYDGVKAFVRANA